MSSGKEESSDIMRKRKQRKCRQNKGEAKRPKEGTKRKLRERVTWNKEEAGRKRVEQKKKENEEKGEAERMRKRGKQNVEKREHRMSKRREKKVGKKVQGNKLGEEGDRN